jgi:hypothetical protein
MSVDTLTRRDRELFLGNLPANATVGQVRKHVEDIGVAVADVDMQRAAGGQAIWAVVTLASAAECARALELLPSRPLIGRLLRVGPRTPSRRVLPLEQGIRGSYGRGGGPYFSPKS